MTSELIITSFFEKRRNLGAETVCPDPDIWVRFSKTGHANSQIEVKDHEVRKSDQMQFVVGNYIDSGAKKHCFIAKLNVFGEILESAYMKNNFLGT